MIDSLLLRIASITVLLSLMLPRSRTAIFDAGMRWLYIVVIGTTVTFLLVPVCGRLARRWAWMDHPDERKRHRDPTPLLGGVAIAGGIYAAILLNGVILPKMQWPLIGGAAILALGLADDRFRLSPQLRLAIQAIIALGVTLVGDVRLTLFAGLSFAEWINVPLTVIWIVGLTNAMNFFDGVDGLATGLSATIAVFLCGMAFQSHQPSLGWLAIAVLGGCIGFFPHNCRIGRPAAIFLGDAGATFLGFVLACLAIVGQWSAGSTFVSAMAPVLVFGILIFDMIYVTSSRVRFRGRGSVWQVLVTPGEDHLHHRLLFMGFAPKEVTGTIVAMAVCLGVSALIVARQDVLEAVLALGQAVVITGLVVVLMWRGADRTPIGGDRRQRFRRKADRRGAVALALLMRQKNGSAVVDDRSENAP